MACVMLNRFGGVCAGFCAYLHITSNYRTTCHWWRRRPDGAQEKAPKIGLYLIMQYSREKIDFFNGDIELSFDFIPTDGEEKELMVDATRHYTSGEKRVHRFYSNGFIEDLYLFKRYQLDITKGYYEKYRLSVETKFLIISQIREFEQEIQRSKENVVKHDYSQLKDEINVIIDAYKVNYENLWWRVKLPIILSSFAFLMTVILAIDKYLKILPSSI